ncbi:MAG: ribosomal methyltransferase [Bacteroidetes bacterium]|jgi:ribosomal protein L11 methyltransferase|nr:ribosomal methyltransferase [Bacteroidota bacterium]
MRYLAYHFVVTPPQPGSEILMALISDQGFESFDTTSTGFTAYIKEQDAVSVNFDDIVFEGFEYNFSVEKIEQKNWNQEWEKNFQPVVVRNLLCIRAPFHPENNDVIHEIIIMPKMSFGTGHHQTTQLVCAAMFEQDFHNKRVLDMGCGTGVLAILAKVLGAKDILGIDIDEWSVENSIENCATNNASSIVIKKGDIDLVEKEKNFDIILANINKNILKKHIPVYSSKLNSGGKLFLSGFFKTDAEELIEFCQKNKFKLDTQNSKDEWTMLVMEKF